MKKYLFLAIAALGFAACSDSDLNGGKDPIHKGEIEESYIAINLSASDITRADDGIYQEGDANERAVANAHFFFFKDGQPFTVNATNAPATEPGGTVNHLAATLSGSTSGMNNVSDIKDAVLLLSTYKGEYPNQIVAVLNWNPDNTSYSLTELEAAMENISVSYTENGSTTTYFTMSNAVYANNGNIAVKAAPLTADNIKSSADEAKAAPVKIYVERLAAKVTVTTADGSNKFELHKSVNVNGDNVEVYAHILGWELYNNNKQSFLLKHIDTAWTNEVTSVGFNWNDPAWYRSYWATSLPRPTDPSNAFKMTYTTDEQTANGFANQYGFNIGNKTNVVEGTYVAGTYTYLGENTNGQEPGTKVILKAKLGKEDGTALEIGLWNGVQYVGESDLRTAVANTLKYTLFSKNGDTYTGIAPEDLECVKGGSGAHPAAAEINEVYFQLSDAAEAKDWYKLVSGNYIPVATDVNTDQHSVNATNSYLAENVQSAVLYQSAETFYYVDIKHLGAPSSLGEYGVVRNHIYNVTVNAIGGYGSPVYEGTTDTVTPTYPDTPEEEESFVAAQINILSWRLVDQEVDIQPQN